MEDVLVFLFPLNNYSGIFSSLILDMNLFERCDQSVNKIIETWKAVTWIPCQEFLLCATFNNVSGNPHRNTDSQGRLSTHCFLVILGSTSHFPGLDVLQHLWDLRPVRGWVPDRSEWRLLGALNICKQNCHLFMFPRWQTTTFSQNIFCYLWSFGNCQLSLFKANTIQAFGIVPELRKGPSPGQWKIHPV